MSLPVLVHRSRKGPEEFRVIRPAEPLTRAALIDHDRYLGAYLDGSAARGIAELWLLAARSPRSLVHVPLRANGRPDRAVPGGAGSPLDLVLLHHSLQFAPSDWKRVRGRLGPGRPQTVSLPEAEGAAPAVDHAARHHRENRDLFHQHVHAETLFMTGSTKVFRESAQHFLTVSREGPLHTPDDHGSTHFCTRLYGNAGILGKDARELHIEYCDQWVTPV
ncbi:hypothetical protein ACFYOG_30765 [Streptomyces sp. NPDC007818]|uniref:hypothetical protein n=1 Tax=Streptomyces sp. NPDC007818 TaxID=3364780 RepID=UPI0036AC30A7